VPAEPAGPVSIHVHAVPDPRAAPHRQLRWGRWRGRFDARLRGPAVQLPVVDRRRPRQCCWRPASAAIVARLIVRPGLRFRNRGSPDSVSFHSFYLSAIPARMCWNFYRVILQVVNQTLKLSDTPNILTYRSCIYWKRKARKWWLARTIQKQILLSSCDVIVLNIMFKYVYIGMYDVPVFTKMRIYIIFYTWNMLISNNLVTRLKCIRLQLDQRLVNGGKIDWNLLYLRVHLVYIENSCFLQCLQILLLLLTSNSETTINDRYCFTSIWNIIILKVVCSYIN